MTGSSPCFVPRPNTDKPGKSLSLARACISLADPMTPIRAEKKVVAHSPAKIKGAQILVSWMILGFPRKEAWVVLDASDTITSTYAIKVDSMAHNVPTGIALLGFFRSPDMEAPAKMPEVAGKRIPNRSRNVARPWKDAPAECGSKLDFSVCQLTPVNSMPRPGSLNGRMNKAEKGMLRMATIKITSRALLALANMPLPAKQSAVQKIKATL